MLCSSHEQGGFQSTWTGRNGGVGSNALSRMHGMVENQNDGAPARARPRFGTISSSRGVNRGGSPQQTPSTNTAQHDGTSGPVSVGGMTSQVRRLACLTRLMCATFRSDLQRMLLTPLFILNWHTNADVRFLLKSFAQDILRQIRSRSGTQPVPSPALFPGKVSPAAVRALSHIKCVECHTSHMLLDKSTVVTFHAEFVFAWCDFLGSRLHHLPLYLMPIRFRFRVPRAEHLTGQGRVLFIAVAPPAGASFCSAASVYTLLCSWKGVMCAP